MPSLRRIKRTHLLSTETNGGSVSETGVKYHENICKREHVRCVLFGTCKSDKELIIINTLNVSS